MATRMETVVPISDLQSRSKALVEQVKKTGLPVIITQRGRPAAMLVSCDLYEGHLATLDEASFPDAEVRLARAEREIAAGQLLGHDAVVKRAGRRKRS